MASSQNGYPASADRAAIRVTTFAVPGHPNVKLPLRDDVAPLLLEMCRWWFATIEPPVMPGCWGYAWRSIRGSSTVSNHASGTAVDINAPRHPLGKVGTVPASKRGAISQKAANLGLRWGGDYTGRKDEMHVEVIVSLTTARLYVARLQGTPVPPLPPPTPTGRPALQQGSHGNAVTSLQQTLNRWYPRLKALVPDGMFGPATRARVLYFQQRAHLVADGIVGARTWAALGFK
jgi:hypothetical protein